MDDLISRQAAIDGFYEIASNIDHLYTVSDAIGDYISFLESLPAQPELHYCRECKFSEFHANVDKYGKSEIYWRCRNWHGETDEEGYCHEWKRKTDG